MAMNPERKRDKTWKHLGPAGIQTQSLNSCHMLSLSHSSHGVVAAKKLYIAALCGGLNWLNSHLHLTQLLWPKC